MGKCGGRARVQKCGREQPTAWGKLGGSRRRPIRGFDFLVMEYWKGKPRNVLKNEFGAEGDDCSGRQIEVVYTGMLSLALRPKQFLRWLMGPVY